MNEIINYDRKVVDYYHKLCDLTYRILLFLYKRRETIYLPFILGFITSFVMPPFNMIFIAPITFSCIIRITDFNINSTKSIFKCGFFFSLGFGLGVFYWISFSLLTDKSYYIYFPFVFVGIPFLYAVYNSLLFILYKELSINVSALLRTIIFSSLWVSFEYLRGFVIMKLPIGFIGYGLSSFDCILQIASVVGVLGVGFLFMIWTTSFHLLFLNGDYIYYIKFIRYCLSINIVVIVLAIFGAFRIAKYHNDIKNSNSNRPLIRIVQAAINHKSTIDVEYINKKLNKYSDLSSQGDFDDIDYLIWPESAIIDSVYHNPPLVDRLSKILNVDQVLFAGSLRVQEDDMAINHLSIYNSLSILDSEKRQAYYDKHYLVPFGEYIPSFLNIMTFGLFNKIMTAITDGVNSYSPGSALRVMNLTNDVLPFTPLICFESAFSGKIPLYNKTHDTRAQWILNITNDSWFRYSTGPSYNLAMSKLRAIETGLPLVRAADTGVSAVFNPVGEMISYIPFDTTGFIDVILPNSIQSNIFAKLPSISIIVIIIIDIVLFVRFGKDLLLYGQSVLHKIHKSQ